MRTKVINLVSIIVAFSIGAISTFYIFNDREVAITNNGKEVINNITLTESDSISKPLEEIYDATVFITAYYGGSPASTGSGFVYKVDDEYGYIITNNHVVEDSTSLTIMNTSGQTYDAEIVGTDVYSDLAVLKIKEEGVLKVATLGISNDSKVGDTVFTVGSPLGVEYMNTVTKGTLSGKDRMVETTLSNGDYMMEVIQVDAAINPGNSGGPLCNLKGEVIGVNSLKLVEEEVEGMGFAIPSETVMLIVEQLELGKEVARPYLGINTISVDDSWQLYRNGIYLDNSIKEGIVIVRVETGSVAEKAGLKKADVLVEIDGVKIKSSAHFKYLLYKHKVGDTVSVKYNRNKKINEITIQLMESSK